MNEKILVIAAHPDDEILGCGATMYKHTKKGDDVFVLILGAGIESRFTKNLNNKKIDLKKKKIIQRMH